MLVQTLFARSFQTCANELSLVSPHLLDEQRVVRASSAVSCYACSHFGGPINGDIGFFDHSRAGQLETTRVLCGAGCHGGWRPVEEHHAIPGGGERRERPPGDG